MGKGCRTFWELTPFLAVQKTISTWPFPAELLEEICYTVALTLVTDTTCPILFHRAVIWTALAPDDDPIDGEFLFWPINVQHVFQLYWANEWFNAQETNGCWNLRQDRNALVGGFLILDARAQPNVRPTVAPIGRQAVKNAFWALREELPIQVWCSTNERPQTRKGSHDGRVCLKDVAHAGAEHLIAASNGLGLLLPREWFVPVSVTKLAARLVRPPHIESPTIGGPFSITESAALRNFGAPPNYVESVVAP